MTRIPFAIVLAVCSSCGPGLDPGQDPAASDGGTHDNTGSDAASPTETKAGTLTIESSRYTVSTTTVEQGYATGTFYRIPAVKAGAGGCTTTTYGSCDVQTCVVASTPTDAGLSITYTDAGPLTISGVQVNDGTMMLAPGPYGYTTVSGSVALFDGGDTVRFVASGNPNGAPGFDVSLVAPSAAQVTAPVFVQGKVAASATHDLAVAWSGSSSDVTAQLAAGTTAQSVVARCSFAGASGHGVVPAAVIAAIQSAGGYASVIVMTESRATRNPDGWNIAFALQSYGLVASGIAAGTLEIQ